VFRVDTIYCAFDSGRNMRKKICGGGDATLSETALATRLLLLLLTEQ